ncbi:hypothetical protein BASA81_015373 [Batrachochytrium salamandrivorans]|nr:hypothetical protein BASA81_015373 [Batrachochytrium salamandrivorans]
MDPQTPAAVPPVSEAVLQALAKFGIAQPSAPAAPTAKPDSHKFWGTQPVPQTAGQALPLGPIEVKTVADVKKDPYKLPEGFEWCLIDWENDAVLEECYVLLRDNYVEDDDAMFRFDYSKEFLRWALMPPTWRREWQVGVMQSSNKKIRAMITGTPQLIRTCEEHPPTLMCEINFLCIHKKLRAQRLAPVLIKEVTRRVNLTNVFQAVYTAGVSIPTPIGVPAKYWHRSLNPRKLIDIGFSSLGHRQTIQRLTRILELPPQVTTPGWRPLEKRDLAQVFTLLTAYLSQFRLHVEFHDLVEVGHIFLPQPGVVSSYVVENKKGQITDFASFYHLYSSIMKNPKHKTLRAGYSFYNAPGSLSLQDLYANLLIEAQKQDMDVFNALDLMKNRPCFEPLKFGIGDGNLHYYLFNYSMGKPCDAPEVGIVLV